jgi:mannose-1-phosphate guanylyltransferase
LKSLTTTNDGVAVPKQFCSLNGGASLLGDALQRAETVASREHICVVVAEQHRRFWKPLLESRDSENIIVQPQNRGTAIGILLPLLHIAARDPEARIIVLPSDHYVRDEAVLGAHLAQALRQLDRPADEIVLLGMQPDEFDAELGYIVPGTMHVDGLRAVKTFIEKPSESKARELMRTGALWNVFIMAARLQTLLQVFEGTMPGIVAAMRSAVAIDASTRNPSATAALYRTLRDVDFSRDIAQKHESALRVLTVPPCGWSDLGTPKRVGQALQRAPRSYAPDRAASWGGHLNLAIQHALMKSDVLAAAR